MAKLKGSFGGSSKKPPSLGTGSKFPNVLPRESVPKDLASRTYSLTSGGLNSEALKFGTLHTKSTSVGTSGSQWTSLLSSASGGITSVLGGGLLSSGGFGFVSTLLKLFGGGKSTPAAPVAFQIPAAQQKSIDIAPAVASSSVSLGVQPVNANTQSSGIYRQIGSHAIDPHTNSAQVVQIVKQALLTSSSLNDVISEI